MTKAVRTEIGPDARLPMRRTLVDRLVARWPGTFAALSRAGQHLPPRSRLRRALIRSSALSGWGAWVRGDLDLCLVRFAPDYHYDPPREWLIAGMPDVYRGHAGLRQWAADLHEAWDFLDHTPLEVVDAGDRVAFLCRIRLRARTSGIELDSRLGPSLLDRAGFDRAGERLRRLGGGTSRGRPSPANARQQSTASGRLRAVT